MNILRSRFAIPYTYLKYLRSKAPLVPPKQQGP